MTDTRPPVAPVEGHYAMLRNGDIARPREEQWANRAAFFEGPLHWWGDGKSIDNNENFDIIATISPDVMARAVSMSGEDQGPLTKAPTRDPMPIGGDYTIMPTKLAEALTALVPLADAACDYADQNCRWFDISTAPKEEGLSFLVSIEIRNPSTIWREVHVVHLNEDGEIHTDCHQGWSLGDYTHWAPLPPPPSNPPLPDVFTQLGQALEKIKEQR